MKRPVLLLALVAVASVALAGEVTEGKRINSGTAIYGRNQGGTATQVAVTDAGSLQTVPGPGHWDCARTAIGTMTSTGTTNHGSLNTITAGSYVIGYCTGAAYVGGPSYYVNDGGAGNAATCASRDGGTIPHDACHLYSAYERFHIDLRNTNYNSIGVTSAAAATVNCPLAACAN